MDRTPPIGVRRILRREVGFGCPVQNCGSPYLRWHHFDPPWRVREHHNPAGMIALCSAHHDKADAGAFTAQQLDEFKKEGRARAAQVRGRFDWMRNRLLAVVGANFFYEVRYILTLRGEPAIWLNRDEDGYLLLNVRMLTASKLPRIQMEDSYWIARGEMIDFECPPSGRLIHAKYENGDELRIEFFELHSADSVTKRYPDPGPVKWRVQFPITTVEITSRVGGTEIAFGPDWSELPGGRTMRGVFAANCPEGLRIG